MTTPGTFNYQAFEATLLACDASALQLQQHVQYDALLKWGCHLHHPESFFANEDINLKDKQLWVNEDVSEDNNTIQISNVSHLGVVHGNACPVHPTGNHKWWECTDNPDNQSVNQGALTFSPLPQQSDANKINNSMTAKDDQAELL